MPTNPDQDWDEAEKILAAAWDEPHHQYSHIKLMASISALAARGRVREGQRSSLLKIRQRVRAARAFIASEYSCQNDEGHLIPDPIPRKRHDDLCDAEAEIESAISALEAALIPHP